jgi:hypothetical protein
MPIIIDISINYILGERPLFSGAVIFLALAGIPASVPGDEFVRSFSKWSKVTALNLHDKSAGMLFSEDVRIIDPPIGYLSPAFAEFFDNFGSEPFSAGTEAGENWQDRSLIVIGKIQGGRKLIASANAKGDFLNVCRSLAVVVQNDDKPAWPRDHLQLHGSIVGGKDDGARGCPENRLRDPLRLNNHTTRYICSFDLAAVSQLASVNSIDRPSEPTYNACGESSNRTVMDFK